jgi:hypothetical protein
MAMGILLKRGHASAGDQDDLGAGVGPDERLDEPPDDEPPDDEPPEDELPDVEPPDEEPPEDEPPDDEGALEDFSPGLAAGAESDFAALFSADSEFDLPFDSALESLR